jgi:hypothetical protein
LGEFAACLPEVTVDESLQTEMPPLQGGSAGTVGKGSSSAGTGGAAGADTTSAGTGGAAGTAGDSMTPNTATGGAAGTDGGTMQNSSGAGGTADMGQASAGSGGAGGTSSPPAGGSGGIDGAGVATRCPLTTDLEEACGAYCQLYNSTCSSSLAYDYQDQAGQDCASVCYNAGWPIGNYTEKGSILCRCYHAYLALTEQAPTPHCYHSAQTPTMGPGGCQPDP